MPRSFKFGGVRGSLDACPDECILQDAYEQLSLRDCSCASAGIMAPFNFTQRASSRTAIKMQSEDLKMDKLDLSTPTAPSSTALKEAQLNGHGSRFGGKMSQSQGTFEPSKAFVRQLAAKSDYRCVREKRPLSMTVGETDRASGPMHVCWYAIVSAFYSSAELAGR